MNQAQEYKNKEEFLACRKNMKTLFYSGYFVSFFTCLREVTSIPAPYANGRLKGLQEIIDKNPNHPFAIKAIAFKEASKNGNETQLKQAKKDLEATVKQMMDAKTIMTPKNRTRVFDKK